MLAYWERICDWGGSIVTHDVEPYSIVAGNPARVLRMRFDEDTCAALE